MSGDTRIPGVVVDPRQLGLNGGSSVATAAATYAIGEAVEAFYEFGRARYEGYGGGPSDRTLLNARVGLEKGRWDVSLWSRNLLDEKYVSNSFVVFFANSCVASLGDARSFGLTVRYRL